MGGGEEGWREEGGGVHLLVVVQDLDCLLQAAVLVPQEEEEGEGEEGDEDEEQALAVFHGQGGGGR